MGHPDVILQAAASQALAGRLVAMFNEPGIRTVRMC